MHCHATPQLKKHMEVRTTAVQYSAAVGAHGTGEQQIVLSQIHDSLYQYPGTLILSWCDCNFVAAKQRSAQTTHECPSPYTHTTHHQVKYVQSFRHVVLAREIPIAHS